MKRTRLKHQSHTARTIANQRRQLAKRHHTPPRCHIPGCTQPADDIHEPLTRARGGDPTDPFNTIPLCREHHDRVDADPRWAESLGLLVSQYSGYDPMTIDSNAVNPTTNGYSGGMAERRNISLRVSDQADDLIESTSKRLQVNRALVLRSMLSVASAHMDEVERKIQATRDVR